MIVTKSIEEVRSFVNEKKKEGLSVGFVPTMGYLHEGHASLLKESKKENDITILSIYVNPTQFGPNEDLSSYPRDMERDCKIAEEEGVDLVFTPTDDVLYPGNYKTYVYVEGLTNTLCGRSRPTHFRGVTTIVTKLFNIVAPHNAYFGQKDAQQYFVLNRMATDLNMDICLKSCPIIREEDGLAKSSRNVYLNEKERQQATILNKSLNEAVNKVKEGERSSLEIVEGIRSTINSMDLANIDYVEIVDTETMQQIDEIKNKVLIAIAVKFGNTRLIDNRILEV
ncbi:pantothenate synthetase [Dethiosulfatibacter aminovorans DSM 17477]|uniref:Pantothenate synthetase n=1 Tax=Dethiosulfatibacter aminovorans DSM 17477 TaxID=1121476 RepID=A0A1M6E7Q8_9FIRM|nr:pantoate--beta-alanine ligase [Dethiosulfatibacter aminovorans]SHI81512.1 pantothenate synthetase [Dethiosulfatibacter aminovorans DSM 17477]